MNRILVRSDELVDGTRATLEDGRAEHIRSVLRSSLGDTLRVGIINGPPGTARVVELAEGPETRVTLECTFEAQAPARPRVDVVLALPRPKVLRRLWSQLAALGVDRLWLTNAAKVERSYFDTHWLQPAGYTPLLVEGAAQASDTQLPQVEVHRSFRRLVEDVLGTPRVGLEQRVVAHPSAGPPLVRLPVGAGQRIVLAVGPEGGWNAFELDLLAAHGFAPAQLGPRILRSDTACVALVSLAHALLD